ncbi:hypothetical protein [Pseudoalteromonas piscicida]|uniref:hypothetical protein n=1 Tax=Pseudoalteromonas piscicida TaxID=43662 RepID=UPI000E35E3FD|nr:hypothetical protein [Pseudoalteromonas piscicida]AXQ98021.1 hypothetical protein D0N37_09815 [Pseudoalteromonas piscicida]
MGDINKIKDNLAAVDAVAESILEQAIADNAALVANLQSRGEFNQKPLPLLLASMKMAQSPKSK